uniref:Circadian locomoter output cycles protein kaput n=1 Tax=Glossina brevipalpis TaxID=37001 RepID=A0A1A9W7P9_9MUSC
MNINCKMEDESDDRDDTKRRSRNLSEKKRRDQFNSLVNDLSALISTSNRKMDKSTVLKSTIAFLKHHNEATDRSKVFEIQTDWKPSFLSNDEFTQLMLESLDGFIIVFSSRGAIFYASDSITAQLGYLPNDLLKMTIFDLAYEMDHENLFNIFVHPKPVIESMQTDISSRNQISFFVHLKRGGVEESDTNSYELVKFVGYFRSDANVDTITVQNTQNSLPRIFQLRSTVEIDKKLIFVGTGRLQMPQLIREITMIDPTRNEFTSKHSMEWKFLFLDHRAPPIIGYMPFEVLGTSGYDYYHFDDLDNLVACHEELMQAGKAKSGYYRFLTKGQQWIWLQTDFYVSYNQFNAKPEYVVCTHKVVNYMDVLKYRKTDAKKYSNNTVTVRESGKSSTATLRDVESTNANVETTTLTTTGTTNLSIGTNVISGILSNAASPSLEVAAMWTNSSTPSGVGAANCQINPMKTSRPASSYGNISSTGISPNIKRKRYFYNNRGNESDSTSMSADSGTSRHSLMTNLSSNRQRHNSTGLLQSSLHTSNSQSQNSQLPSGHHQQQQHLHHNHHHHSSHHMQSSSQQNSLQMNVNNHGGQQQKLLPMLSQHPIGHTSTSMVSSSSCQFPQPAFPLRNQQLMGPTFLEPPQYLTAIPVQPVIAPFPVAPVLSPMTNQTDMLPSAVVMTPTQTQLQEQLQRKHDELQKIIMQQQDELRMVSEQLLLARYTLLQPMMPINYNSTTGVVNSTSRNYNFNNNSVQSQFNHIAGSQTGLNQMDSGVPTINNATNVNSTTHTNSSNTTVNHNNSHTSANAFPTNSSTNANHHHTPEDPLLTYMQMATESSSTLNFAIGITDEGSESHSGDTKLLQTTVHHLPTTQTSQISQRTQPVPQSQPRTSFFVNHTYSSLNDQTSNLPPPNNATAQTAAVVNPNTNTANHLPNDLEILPYQMSQEQSQALFSNTHANGVTQ